MAVNTSIFHCDEYFRLPRKEKKEFDSIILKELEENPVKHLETEWGRFENLPPMSEEEIDRLAEDVLNEMSLE